MVPQAPLHGGVNTDYFKGSESMEGFEQVLKWLNFYCKKDIQSFSPTKETLSQMLISFIQSQETKFGKRASEIASEVPKMRLPMRCFFNFVPGGSLCHIFSSIFRYKVEKFDVNQTELEDHYHYAVFENLINLKCFRMPTAYIRREIDDRLRSKIIEILNDRQCEITEDQEQASHVIYPKQDNSPEDYARPSFKQGNNVMIHWYHLPESYDSWVPNTFHLPEDIPESNKLPLRTWCVSANWVLDSNEFNEWMSEEDYEVGDNGEKKVHPHRISANDFYDDAQKNNQQGAKSSALKRKTSAMAKSSTTKPIARSTTTVLPRTKCPDCGIDISIKGLERHKRENHSKSETFKCQFCNFTSKRQATLSDHQRRIHFEPMRQGRPKTKERKRRCRSPFHVETFDDRHTASIKTFQKNLEMKEVLDESVLKFTKNEERLTELEKASKQTGYEFSKVRARFCIIESKQKPDDLPNMQNIPGLLDYLNLTKDSTKEEIRQKINLRLMEISSESALSREIFTSKNMTEEEKQQLTTFYNKASQILIKWKKHQANK